MTTIRANNNPENIRRPGLTPAARRPIISQRWFVRLEWYMHFPIPQLATCILLVHMVFGCCLHHAHSCVASCCESPEPAAQGCGCRVHRHDVEGRDGPENQHKHPQQGDDKPHREDASHEHSSGDHRCDGPSCVFVRTTDAAEWLLEEFALSPAAEFQEREPVGAPSNDGSFCRPMPSGPPLRTHLLYQILLI